MLHFLHIRNLGVASELEIEFSSGLTVITGETGSGKSILIDALSLCLGDRADMGLIRPKCDKAEVALSFSLPTEDARDWLRENDLENQDDLSMCHIRRIITTEGRSRAYINGRVVPIQQLKALGGFVVNLHGQHQHLSLLEIGTQRDMLDIFAEHEHLTLDVKTAFYDYAEAKNTCDILTEHVKARETQLALLQYQVGELSELDLKEREWENLEKEFKTQQHLEETTQSLNFIQNLLSLEGSHSIAKGLYAAKQRLASIKMSPETLQNAVKLLDEADILIQESRDEIDVISSSLESNPERQRWVEARTSKIFETARKHKIAPEYLYEYHQQLKIQLDELNALDITLEKAQEKLQNAIVHYENKAQALSKSRNKYAAELGKAVTAELPALGMPHAILTLVLKPLEEHCSIHGRETVEFNIVTNPEHPPQILSKVVSGGELSRLSLALQRVTATKKAAPCIVFDEVDTGISGITAFHVGKLLAKLGQTTQVILITHLPQVAAFGNHHLYIEKSLVQNMNQSRIERLDGEKRVLEIARMLGGKETQQEAILHASALLEETTQA